MNRQAIIEHCDNLNKLISLETAGFHSDAVRNEEIKSAIRLWANTWLAMEVRGILDECLTPREQFERADLPDCRLRQTITLMASVMTDDQLKEVLKR